MANIGGVVNTSKSMMVSTLTEHVKAHLMRRHLSATCELRGFSIVTLGCSSDSFRYLPLDDTDAQTGTPNGPELLIAVPVAWTRVF